MLFKRYYAENYACLLKILNASEKAKGAFFVESG
jgi:hypothetical protein